MGECLGAVSKVILVSLEQTGLTLAKTKNWMHSRSISPCRSDDWCRPKIG